MDENCWCCPFRILWQWCLGAGERSTNRWVVTIDSDQLIIFSLAKQIQLHYIIFHYFGDSTKLYMFPTILSRVFVNECDIMMLYFKKSIWCFFLLLNVFIHILRCIGKLVFFLAIYGYYGQCSVAKHLKKCNITQTNWKLKNLNFSVPFRTF